jgi:hypothetical protein
MLPVLDPQVRTVLLHHVALRASQISAEEVQAAGLDAKRLRALRRLSVHELERLASMRTLPIGVVLDVNALDGALRAIALGDQARALESHFVLHGASCRLMTALFRLPRKATHRMRQQLGVIHPAGRPTLPDPVERERIVRCWTSLEHLEARQRYQRLHQAFVNHPIAVLEAVIRRSETWR